MAAIPDDSGSSHRIAAGSGEVLGDVPVVCGCFGDFIGWKISKDVIGVQKTALRWVCHHLLKCTSDEHSS